MLRSFLLLFILLNIIFFKCRHLTKLLLFVSFTDFNIFNIPNRRQIGSRSILGSFCRSWWGRWDDLKEAFSISNFCILSFFLYFVSNCVVVYKRFELSNKMHTFKFCRIQITFYFFTIYCVLQQVLFHFHHSRHFLFLIHLSFRAGFGNFILLNNLLLNYISRIHLK